MEDFRFELSMIDINKSAERMAIAFRKLFSPEPIKLARELQNAMSKFTEEVGNDGAKAPQTHISKNIQTIAPHKVSGRGKFKRRNKG